jgi:proton-dependent oligopeptide transporter, POT family
VFQSKRIAFIFTQTQHKASFLSAKRQNMSQNKNEILGHPRGLALLFLTEMWERFSYYGMRAIFSLYMINALMFSKAKASEIYGSYTGLVYLTPLLGGYVADRYWGNQRSILAGGISMALGQLFMFLSGWFYEDQTLAIPFMWSGLAFLILGNGFFKPNISSMVGQLYVEGDRRRDAAFTIFYMGINMGAFLAPLACGFLGDTGRPEDFKWGFLAACGGMITGTLIFYFFKNKYVVTPDGKPVGALPNKAVPGNDGLPSADIQPSQMMIAAAAGAAAFLALWLVFDFDIIGSLIYALCIAVPTLIFIDKSLSKVERDRIIVIFVSAFFVIFFWAAYEQAGASLTFFAEEQTDRSLLGGTIPASTFQSVPAASVVIFAPVLAALWVFLSKRKLEPNSLLKQAAGLVILALGYVVIAYGVKGAGIGVKVSMGWLLALYVIHTIGELCLSPIGLSLVSKLSPLRFVSLLFGVWFLSNAVANKAAGQLSSLYPPSEREYMLASENGIDETTYRGILEGTVEPTEEQLAVASGVSLPMEYPSLFGNPITNLVEFFWIFVIMSGIAGGILFLLSFPLRKMMHGAD